MLEYPLARERRSGFDLIAVQNHLIDAQWTLNVQYKAIAQEKQRLIAGKKSYHLTWFRRRMAQLDKYLKAITSTIGIGKVIGDGYAWIFYRDDVALIEQHLSQQRQPHLSLGVGGIGDRALDLARIADVHGHDFDPERWCHRLDRSKLTGAGGNGGIAKDRRPRHIRGDLLQQLKPLTADAVFEYGETSGVAARPRQARYEAGAHWINHHYEYERHCARDPQERCDGRSAGGNYDVRRQGEQFAGGLSTRSASLAPQR